PLTGSMLSKKMEDMFRHPEKLLPKVEDISILDRPAPIPNGPIGDKLRDMLGKGKSGPPSSRQPSSRQPSSRQPSGNGPHGEDDPADISMVNRLQPSRNGQKRQHQAR